MYADNTVIFMSQNKLCATNQLFQTDLNKIATWGQEQGLLLSPSKTKVINFSRKHNLQTVHHTINGRPLEQILSVKFLGLTFYCKLSWTEHIEDTKRKCHSRLNLFKVLYGSSWRAEKNFSLGSIRYMYNQSCIIVV